MTGDPIGTLEKPLTVSCFVGRDSERRDYKEAARVMADYAKKEGDVRGLYEVCGDERITDANFLRNKATTITRHVVVRLTELDEMQKRFDNVFYTRIHSIQQDDAHVFGHNWTDDDSDLVLSGQPVQLPRRVCPSDAQLGEVQHETQTSEHQPTSSKISKEEKMDASHEERSSMKLKSGRAEAKAKPERAAEDLKEFTPAKANYRKSRKSPSPMETSCNEENAPSPAKVIKTEETYSQNTNGRRSQERNEDDKADSENSQNPEKKKTITELKKTIESFVDEDGFLVSREVRKLVEVPISEVHEKPVCTTKKSSKEVQKPAAAKKPMTITSFFGKK